MNQKEFICKDKIFRQDNIFVMFTITCNIRQYFFNKNICTKSYFDKNKKIQKLPVRKILYTLNKSNHVHKKSKEQFFFKYPSVISYNIFTDYCMKSSVVQQRSHYNIIIGFNSINDFTRMLLNDRFIFSGSREYYRIKVKTNFVI